MRSVHHLWLNSTLRSCLILAVALCALSGCKDKKKAVKPSSTGTPAPTKAAPKKLDPTPKAAKPTTTAQPVAKPVTEKPEATCAGGKVEIFSCPLQGGGKVSLCGALLNKESKQAEELKLVASAGGESFDVTLKGDEIKKAIYWNATGPVNNNFAMQVPTAKGSLTVFTAVQRGKVLSQGVWLNRPRTEADGGKQPVTMPSSRKKPLPLPDVQVKEFACAKPAKVDFFGYTISPLTRVDQQWPFKLNAIPHNHTSSP